MELRVELAGALQDGLLPLGLLGQGLGNGKIQAQSMVFPWIREDPVQSNLFDRLCYIDGRVHVETADHAGQWVGRVVGIGSPLWAAMSTVFFSAVGCHFLWSTPYFNQMKLFGTPLPGQNLHLLE